MSKQVMIHSGLHRNEEISGQFTVVTNYRKQWAGYNGPKEGKIEVLGPTGERVGVWVDESDFEYLTEGTAPATYEQKHTRTLTNEELDPLIRERFRTLERLGHGVADGHIKSLIVSGSAGIGKTHSLEQILMEAEKNKKIDGYCSFSGSAGAIGLYKELYNYSGENDVIILDDMDKLFYDLDALNVLKAALDSKPVRKISWLKESRALKDEDIPNTFEYQGSIVFITNEDFHTRMAKQDKLSPHLEAFMSRSSYLDLAIHSVPAILVRIRQVAMETEMLDKQGLTEQEKVDMLNWLEDNQQRIIKVDLRSCMKIASYMAMDRTGWRQIASDCLLKPSFKA